MQKLVCDGCGRGELLSTPQKKRKIRSVRLSVIHDSRTSVPEGTDRYEADLCDSCQGTMLAKYFRVSAKGQLEVPSFLEPTEREREVRIAT